MRNAREEFTALCTLSDVCLRKCISSCGDFIFKKRKRPSNANYCIYFQHYSVEFFCHADYEHKAFLLYSLTSLNMSARILRARSRMQVSRTLGHSLRPENSLRFAEPLLWSYFAHAGDSGSGVLRLRLRRRSPPEDCGRSGTSGMSLTES